MAYFKEFHVWKSADDKKLFRYRCFELIQEKKYVVQSKDTIYDNETDQHSESQRDYFYGSLFYGGLEGLNEIAFDSIEEAIEKFESDFD